VVLRHLASELNWHPASEAGTGGQPERRHTRLAAGIPYSNATEVLPWIATAQNEPFTEPLQTLAVPTAPPRFSDNLGAGRPAFDHGGVEELAERPRLRRASLNDRPGCRTEVAPGAD
jgi:hypothetical protein